MSYQCYDNSSCVPACCRRRGLRPAPESRPSGFDLCLLRPSRACALSLPGETLPRKSETALRKSSLTDVRGGCGRLAVLFIVPRRARRQRCFQCPGCKNDELGIPGTAGSRCACCASSRRWHLDPSASIADAFAAMPLRAALANAGGVARWGLDCCSLHPHTPFSRSRSARAAHAGVLPAVFEPVTAALRRAGFGLGQSRPITGVRHVARSFLFSRFLRCYVSARRTHIDRTHRPWLMLFSWWRAASDAAAVGQCHEPCA